MDNYFCLLKTNVLSRGVFSLCESLTNCHLYHYAGNNPVRYVDPEGKFDFEDFFYSLRDLFKSREKKFSMFDEYKSYQISKSDYEYLSNNFSLLANEVELVSCLGKYYIEIQTDFGKLPVNEKLFQLNMKLNSLGEEYNSNKIYFKDSYSSILYSLCESLPSYASYSSFEEFYYACIFNNAETIADVGQFDIDEINLLLDIYYIEGLKKMYEEYD